MKEAAGAGFEEAAGAGFEFLLRILPSYGRISLDAHRIRLRGLPWRSIEVAVTRTTRNRFVGVEPARGFESHLLRMEMPLYRDWCRGFLVVEGIKMP